MAYEKPSREKVFNAVDTAIAKGKKILFAYSGTGDYKIKIESGIFGLGTSRFLVDPGTAEEIKSRIRQYG